jgi:hypothetical protein
LFIIYLTFSFSYIDIGISAVGKLNLQHGADDDDFHILIQEKSETIQTEKIESKKKIVKF